METYLQFGHGMMEHSKNLIKKRKGGAVILSPRDLEENQLIKMAEELTKIGGTALLDPQCFARNADHHRLTKHKYWSAYSANNTLAFVDGSATETFLRVYSALANKMGITKHIIPGLLASNIDEDWFMFHEHMLKQAPKFLKGELLATIALSADVMESEALIEEIVDRTAAWKLDGFYIVPEIPESYLVSSSIWLANLMILASGLKLQKRQVIVGYCNHQTLCLAAAKVDAIASGTWLNVRAFQPDKFYTPDEDDISRRTKWYYCPQALTEYKMNFLDVAKQLGILNSMKSDPGLGSSFADPLFAGATPSSVEWNERDAFRHYLTCLHGQAASLRRNSFDTAYDAYLNMLNDAGKVLKTLSSRGVRGGDRDFSDYVDVGVGAMEVFKKARGARLRRSWSV